ncbi:MAG: SEL1-like repeat protein [Neisseriaceae bacterium]|nr:SEL1-like repeat protein [Neisseriaceae bacterium]
MTRSLWIILLASAVFYLSACVEQQQTNQVDCQEEKVCFEKGEDYFLNYKDYTQAKIYYEKAAEQGYAEAQNRLGIMYSSSSYGLEINYTKAKEYFEQAAEQGLKQAQFNLGNMYKYGKGVPQDYSQTIKWYKKAAEQGAAPAQYGLGDMYAKGLGVEKDLSQAQVYLKQACQNNYLLACQKQ